LAQTSGTNQHPYYYVSNVTYPNGEVISYTYDTATPGYPPGTYRRPTQISSNLGYFIAITYQGNVFGTNEWGTPASAAIYNSSTPGTPLASLTYSSDGTTITDLGGRIYHCTGCTNTLGIDLETSAGSIQLPGEASAASQVTPVSGSNVVASVTRDGVAWTYGYTNLR